MSSFQTVSTNNSILKNPHFIYKVTIKMDTAAYMSLLAGQTFPHKSHFTFCTPCAPHCCISSRFIFPLKYLHLTTLSNWHNHLNFFNLIGLRHCALHSHRLFVFIDITCRAKTAQSAMWSNDGLNTGCQSFTTIGRLQPVGFISSPAGGLLGEYGANTCGR